MKLNIHYAYLVLSSILFGGVIFGGKVLTVCGLSWIELLILPNAIGAILLFWFAKSDFKKYFKASISIMILYPITLIMIQVGQYTPLFLGMSVSMTELLLYTQPLWTILINKFIFKNHMKPYENIVAVFIIAGVVILINPFKDFSFSILGAILAIMAGIGLSVCIIIGTSLSRNNIKPSTLAFFTNFYLSLPFILVYPILSKLIKNDDMLRFSIEKSGSMWLMIITYTLLIYIFATMLFYKGAEKVPSMHSGLILILEPVFAVLLDVIFFKTQLNWHILLGGSIIIGANTYLVIQNSLHENKLQEKRLEGGIVKQRIEKILDSIYSF